MRNSGYICLNSYVSPSMASWRFSAVDFIPPMIRRWLWACTVSAAEAALNSLAICGYPSSSAFLANARYLRFASLSPMNADFRFSFDLLI